MNLTNVTSAEKSVWGALNAIPNTTNMRKLFLTLTRAHFADDHNFGPLRDVLSGLIWTDDQKTRKIKIELQHQYNVGPIQDFLPCISVGVGKTTMEEEVIGNYAGHNADNSVEYKVVEATTPLQWVSYATEDDLCSNLAETLFSFFSAIRRMLTDQVGLRHFHMNEIDMPVRISPPDKIPYFRVDLRGIMKYNHVIALHTESHRLKKVVLEQTAEQSTETPAVAS